MFSTPLSLHLRPWKNALTGFISPSRESSPTKAYLSRFLLFICSVAVNTPGLLAGQKQNLPFLVCRCEIYSNPLYRKLKTGIFYSRPHPFFWFLYSSISKPHHVKWRDSVAYVRFHYHDIPIYTIKPIVLFLRASFPNLSKLYPNIAT